MITRRQILLRTSLALTAPSSYSATGSARLSGLDRAIATLEKPSGGRLGVAVLDTGTGSRAGHRVNERFPMCSTFKLLAAGAVLARVDAGREHLERRIVVQQSDLLPHSPATGKRTGPPGMSVRDLCAAAMRLSDNAAANVLLRTLGGPSGVTRFVRSLGDPVTRLDRTEPDLNDVAAGDPRDTTTPEAMAGDLQRLVLGDALSPRSREILKGWLLANQTGDERLRAGVPKKWKVGDKTGTGERNTANDVAIFWPSGHAPVIAAVYFTGSSLSPDQCNATIATVGRTIAAMLFG